MQANEEARLKLIGILTTDPNVPLRPLVEELGVSYSALFNWRKEFIDAAAATEVTDVVHSDIPVTELAKESSVLAKGVDSLRMLDTALSATALSIVQRTARMLNKTDLEPRDMLVLANAISTLQDAFFAKGTNVNVLQYNEAEGGSGLQKFKELMRA